MNLPSGREPSSFVCCAHDIIYNNYIINIYYLLVSYSFILETYIAPLKETITHRRSKPSHGQRRSTSERCKIWKGGPPEGTAAKRGFHSMPMDPQPKKPCAA